MTIRLPDEWLEKVIESWPRSSDRQPLSPHLIAEIAWSHLHGPLQPGEPVPGCHCERCTSELHAWNEQLSTKTYGPVPPGEPIPSCHCKRCLPEQYIWDPVPAKLPLPAEGDREAWNTRVDQARSVSLLDITPALGLGDPKRQGREYVVRCPLHEDTKPSLRINPLKGVWHCFPCGEGGDGLKLVMRALRIGFADAVRWVLGEGHLHRPGTQ
jgi:CHC2 zinc finger